MSNFQLVLIDDDKNDLKLMELFSRKANFDYCSFEDPKEALEYVETIKGRSFLIVCDISMPDMSGFDILNRYRLKDKFSPIVFVSGMDSIDYPVRAMREGALDFLVKPVSYDLFETRINKATERVVEKTELSYLKEDVFKGHTIHNFIGKSEVIRNIYEMVHRVAKFDSTVLITGESGVGKERVARAIHEYSPRQKKEFVAVNCASIPDTLVESELFGYRKGAFTGASTDKKGIIEVSSGGTLFLDEIGELPMQVQAKLLRVLQEKQVRPVGSKEAIPVDLRIVGATHRDLSKMVSAGEFREDLFYRLHVIPIHIPPLRSRKEDLEVLIPYFVRKNEEKWRVNKKLSQSSYRILKDYNWPGNVRELENVIERAFVLSDGCEMTVSETYFNMNTSSTDTAELFQLPKGKLPTLREIEFQYIREVMRRTSTKEEAARVLGIGRKTLYRKEEQIFQ